MPGTKIAKTGVEAGLRGSVRDILSGSCPSQLLVVILNRYLDIWGLEFRGQVGTGIISLESKAYR